MADEIAVDGWQVLLYRPNKMIFDVTKNMILLAVGLIAVCVITSVLAALFFSKLVVKDIERLQKNMETIEQGDMTLRVSSDSCITPFP